MAKPTRPTEYREGNSSQTLEMGPDQFPLGLCFHIASESAQAPTVGKLHRRGTVFVVKHAQDDDGRPTEPDVGSIEGVYTIRSAAEQRRRELVEQERRAFCRHGYDVLGRTSLPPAVLGDLVLDSGLVPPQANLEDPARAWDDWFAAAQPAMNDWQRQQFLEALDLLGRYSVIELELLD